MFAFLRRRTSTTLIFIAMIAAIYAIVLWRMHWLQFPLDRDEEHLWPTSLLFSHSLIPPLHTLRDYAELNTPLPFLIFGQIQRLFGHGLVLSRYLNLTLSAALVVLIGFVHGRPTRTSALSVLGLILFPYYLGVATHAYTDILAAFLSTLGIWMHLRRRYAAAALCWMLAIASRQYMVAFPLGVAAYELIASASESGRLRFTWRASWMCPLAAALSLLAWICFFGGLAPGTAIAHQRPSSVVANRFFVDHALYFLACIGAYYCLPEAILFGVTSPRSPESPAGWRLCAMLAILLAAAFVAFPPIRNVGFAIEWHTMGYLDIAARWMLNDLWRVVLLYAFALWAVVRFSTTRNTLPIWLLAANALVMTKAHIAWDKYALPMLCVLWLLALTAPSHFPILTARPNRNCGRVCSVRRVLRYKRIIY